MKPEAKSPPKPSAGEPESAEQPEQAVEPPAGGDVGKKSGAHLAGAVQVLPEKAAVLPEKAVLPENEAVLPEKEASETSPTEKSTSAHIADDGKPRFVKHINKTRTMSGRQKWDWAFERIMQVGTRGRHEAM